jgi:hypothetical protein
MADQNNNPWQVVSETPASQQTPPQSQSAPASASTQSSPWQVVNQTTADGQTQPFTDAHLDRMRQLNENRPWWRKMLGIGPSSDAMTANDKAEEQKFWDEQKVRMTDALRDNFKARSDVPVGAVKAAGRSAVGAANLAIKGYDKVTGGDKPTLTSLITGKTGHQIEMPKALESDGSFGQEAGGMFEGVLEFIAGDEILKTLSVAEKFRLGAKIATLAEESPALGKLINMGLNATRTGIVSGTQEAVHGGSVDDVLTSAGTGFLTSVGSEGLGALSKLAKPGTKQIAGEAVQTAPAWKGVGTAARLAKANQEPAQKIISNVARDSAQSVLDKFGKQAPESIASFGDAAKEVQAAAKPTFTKLDELSNGQFNVARNELANATKIARRATSVEDLEAAEKAVTTAQSKIDDIIAKSAGKIAPEDLDNAKSAWRASKVLEKLHGKIDAAYSAPQTASEIAGTGRTLELPKLQGKLNAAFKAIPQADIQSVLGAEGTRNLYDLAALGADPLRAKSLSDVATAIGEHIGIGSAGLAVGALAGHAVPGGSAALGIHFLYAHPEVGQIVVKGLSKGLTPKVIVPTVLQLLQQQRSE